MARLDRKTALGALHVVGWRSEVMEAAAELAVDRASASFRGIERIVIAGEDAMLKASPMHGRSALRWGLKHAFGARFPRVNEYSNLSWLTERLFATPLPLAAGAIVVRGIPRWQFLVTRRVHDALTLNDWFTSARPANERSAILTEIAREVARMHALRFTHRDLWTRNILVGPPGTLSRVLFLDCWAGGPGPGWRGRGHDVACFRRDMESLWTLAESERWSQEYRQQRAVLG